MLGSVHGYSCRFFKLQVCWLPPTVGNTLTIDAYLMQPHSKNPNYPFKTVLTVFSSPLLLVSSPLCLLLVSSSSPQLYQDTDSSETGGHKSASLLTHSCQWNNQPWNKHQLMCIFNPHRTWHPLTQRHRGAPRAVADPTRWWWRWDEAHVRERCLLMRML